MYSAFQLTSCPSSGGTTTSRPPATLSCSQATRSCWPKSRTRCASGIGQLPVPVHGVGLCLLPSRRAATLTGVSVSRAPQIGTAKKRYEIGLDKLATSETSVAGMQVRGLCTRVHQLGLPAQDGEPSRAHTHQHATAPGVGEQVHAVCWSPV